MRLSILLAYRNLWVEPVEARLALVIATLASANVQDTDLADVLLQGVQGRALADRNHWKPDWQLTLRKQGPCLLAPFQSAKHRTFHNPHWLVEKRYRIETVFGQLVEWFLERLVPVSINPRAGYSPARGSFKYCWRS
jgi:hypothetical protein